MTSLFNYSIGNGQIPREWKAARVTPIPKSGNSEEISNYRPVSVLPVVGKLLEKLVHHQLYVYLEKYSILNEAQSGFRPNHTTQDVLVSTIEDWRRALDVDKLVGSIMLDLSKAFDLVNHSILLKKLRSYGIRGSECKWFGNYLEERRQRVAIDGVYSDWSDIKRGVPQGSILGPLLFTIYVNDLPLVVNSKIKQYADDTTLYCAANDSVELSYNLNADLMKIEDWIENNGLRLNVFKTQMLLLSRRRREKELEKVVIELKGESLSRSRKVKFLGVWIDEGLLWKDHIEAVRLKCFSGLAKLRRLGDVLPISTKKKIYQALVLPHLDYCSVIWMECSKLLQQKIERVQNYAMRLILTKPSGTPSDQLRTSLNWMPLTNRREMFRMILVHRCVHGQAPKYLCELFQTNRNFGQRVTRGKEKLHIFPVHTNFGKMATSFRGAQVWNTLSNSLRQNSQLTSFKSNIKLYFYSII